MGASIRLPSVLNLKVIIRFNFRLSSISPPQVFGRRSPLGAEEGTQDGSAVRVSNALFFYRQEGRGENGEAKLRSDERRDRGERREEGRGEEGKEERRGKERKRK